MSGIILGIPGPWALDNCEASDHYTTKIGGLPDWPIQKDNIRPDLLVCNVCGGSFCLIAQIYAPVRKGTHKVKDRILYILGCVRPECANNPNSWCALRFQKSDEQAEVTHLVEHAVPSTDSSSNWWEMDLLDNAGCNDDDGDLHELGIAISEAASDACFSKSKTKKIHIHPRVAVGRSSDGLETQNKKAAMPVLPCFYICCKEEPSLTDVSSRCFDQSSLIIKDDVQDDETWEPEAYEYDRAMSVDRAYLKFKKCLDAYPEQCFRYSYSGKPLMATKNYVIPEKCGICGAPRNYEMQLMSPLLYFLREAAVGLSTHFLDVWNWMTLIVYTCSESCAHIPDSADARCCWIVAKESIVIQFEDA